MGMVKDDSMALEAKMFSKTVESAQKRVEGNHFAARRNVLQYDDVMNKQRELIYTQRNQVLDGVDIDATIRKMIAESISDAVAFYCRPENTPEEWNLVGMQTKYAWLIGEDTLPEKRKVDVYTEWLTEKALNRLDTMEQQYGHELVKSLEHKVLINNVDIRWMDHIDAMDQLRRSIGMQGYAHRDPVVQFRMESYDMFDEMTTSIREGTVQMLLTAQIRSEADVQRSQTVKITGTSGGGDESEKKRPARAGEKIGRNEPCPCGSGKKYKMCCGR